VKEKSRGWRFAAGPALFAVLLVLTSSPYLLFLHRATGEWTITGKTDHVFIIGQAMGRTWDAAEAWTAFRSVKADWNGIIPYLVSHPGEVAAGAVKSGLNLTFWVLPAPLVPPVFWGAWPARGSSSAGGICWDRSCSSSRPVWFSS
jgi:hypothetical protein